MQTIGTIAINPPKPAINNLRVGWDSGGGNMVARQLFLQLPGF